MVKIKAKVPKKKKEIKDHAIKKVEEVVLPPVRMSSDPTPKQVPIISFKSIYMPVRVRDYE